MPNLSAWAADLPTDVAGSEAQFHDLWMDQLTAVTDPIELALRGGLLAPRFGWIFSAGYQAAIRHTFPQAALEPWSAFAVSEDRSGARPGVVYQKHADGDVLHGTKTWVAASAHCRTVIISAKGEAGTRYYAVPREDKGVLIETRPAGRVLPDLSQGSLMLDAWIGGETLDDQRVPGFQLNEVFYIYLAFLASTWRFYPARQAAVESLLAQALLLLQSGQSGQSGQRDDLIVDDAFLGFEGGVQALLNEMRAQEGEQDALWRRDYKLIAMYSRQPKT